uniref:Inactive hydroxysteroid dehydrogenase-like protein 1 isoform X3 n=1 Tax=Geotrypetes seraphini TaxID=260995 RepID=A0A6P8QMN6_GEOSA|nr:inactive hydroxysteroid dehydrogenase-like protein 1 isoform X3 [Geotrypetes seraphini]
MAAVDSFYLLYHEISRSCSSYMETLALVGAWYTAKKSISLICDCYSLIRLHFIPRLVSKTDLSKQYGKWAIITGGTDGIGKAYAEELASRDMNIILISHNREKLENVTQAIMKTYQYFTKIPEEKLWDIINVNITAASMMIHMVLPGMVTRRKGAIVNISSASCCKPTPQVAAYSASKAYLDHFSRALQYEYASKGIFVQSLTPFLVATNKTTSYGFLYQNRWMAPSPETYAYHAVSTLGISARTTGYWFHSIQFLLARCTPEWLWILITQKVMQNNHIASVTLYGPPRPGNQVRTSDLAQ